MTQTRPDRHQTTRVRQEPRRRVLTVVAVEHLTPRMRRVHFASPALRDFASAAPDDHVKLFFDGGAGPCMRDYTPRRFDADTGELTIDFALHEAGPATAWALSAAVGDRLEIGGPRGSFIVPDDFDWYLLIGDETALPAIGRRVEALRPGVPVLTIAVVESAAEVQTFPAKADWRPTWVFRDGDTRDDTALLRDTLAARALPDGEGYVWIAAEASVARALRAAMIEERGHPKAWIKAASYWTRGKADTHGTIQD
jgi:NADPH-dependent ferric siderophore reductase